MVEDAFDEPKPLRTDDDLVHESPGPLSAPTDVDPRALDVSAEDDGGQEIVTPSETVLPTPDLPDVVAGGEDVLGSPPQSDVIEADEQGPLDAGSSHDNVDVVSSKEDLFQEDVAFEQDIFDVSGVGDSPWSPTPGWNPESVDQVDPFLGDTFSASPIETQDLETKDKWTAGENRVATSERTQEDPVQLQEEKEFEMAALDGEIDGTTGRRRPSDVEVSSTPLVGLADADVTTLQHSGQDMLSEESLTKDGVLSEKVELVDGLDREAESDVGGRLEERH